MSEGKNGDNLVKESVLSGSNNKKYNYKNYLNWNDDQRYEIIDGLVFNLSPAPEPRHQKISMELSRQFSSYLLNKKCEVYAAPFDVCLPENGDANDEEIFTVVQPDLLVICDFNNLDKRGYKGAPDLVIEIISPSSRARDRKIKRELYERFNVKEYWILDYNENTLEVYLLNAEGEYGKPDIYTGEVKVKVSIFEDLLIDLKTIYLE